MPVPTTFAAGLYKNPSTSSAGPPPLMLRIKGGLSLHPQDIAFTLHNTPLNMYFYATYRRAPGPELRPGPSFRHKL